MSHHGFSRDVETTAPVQDSPILGRPFARHLHDLCPPLRTQSPTQNFLNDDDALNRSSKTQLWAEAPVGHIDGETVTTARTRQTPCLETQSI